MLGRHHIALTIFTILPFILPFIFLDIPAALNYGIVFLFAAFIGCLTPDSDVKGKPTIFWKFPAVYFVMQPIKRLSLFLLRNPKFKNRVEHPLKALEEHRGIMHSLFGILLSSLLLTFIFLIVLFFLRLFSFFLVLFVFLGLIVGQFLHLLEDTCTKNGIDWKAPFGYRIWHGTIRTFNYMDKRPKKFITLMFSVSMLVVLGYAFDIVNTWSLWKTYLAIFAFVVVLWFIILIWSQLPEPKYFPRHSTPKKLFFKKNTFFNSIQTKPKKHHKFKKQPSLFGEMRLRKAPSLEMPKMKAWPKVKKSDFDILPKKRGRKKKNDSMWVF